MTDQYIRYCQLKVEGDAQSLDVSEMRVRFQVVHGENLNPQHAEITIYNLSDETVQKLLKKGAYKKVSLTAGYEQVYGLIFSGEIIQIRSYRENPVDTCVSIIARDGAQAHDYGVVNEVLPKGSTFKDQVDAVMKVMKPLGVSPGFIADLGNKKMPKSRVLFGNARDILRRIGFSTDTAPFYQDGKLNMVKNKGYLPGEAAVLNSQTGMIGRPEQTFDGIVARMLLNPKVKVGTRLKIDEKSINQAAFDPAYTAEVNNAMLPSLAADGIYKVLYVDSVGDTRGQPWYTTATCIAASGGQIPLGIAARGIEIPE